MMDFCHSQVQKQRVCESFSSKRNEKRTEMVQGVMIYIIGIYGYSPIWRAKLCRTQPIVALLGCLKVVSQSDSDSEIESGLG